MPTATHTPRPAPSGDVAFRAGRLPYGTSSSKPGSSWLVPRVQAGNQVTVGGPTIGQDQYEFLRNLVYESSGIDLGHDKVELVRSRLQKRLRALRLANFQEYCELLKSEGRELELPQLLDLISTNVTEFFREWRHFEFIRQVALPEWRQRSKSNSRPIFRVWSAACSSGEEPYSIAILLSECLGIHSSTNWQVVATDLSTRVLLKASSGIYDQDRIKLPDPAWLRRYFQKGAGSASGKCRVKQQLRDRVECRRLNLMHTPYPFEDNFDLILCRNVMIYFDRATQEKLVPQLASRLAPGGYLLVGHSESLVSIAHALKCVQPSVYQKS